MCVCTGANIPGLRFRVFLASSGGTEYIKEGMQASQCEKCTRIDDIWIAWACVTVQKSCCPEIVRFLSFNDICWQMKWLVANITNLLRMGRQLRQTEREHTVWLAGSIRRNCATLWWTGIIVLTPTYLPPYLYTLVNTIRLQYTLTVK